jgi:hypothetical protein
MQDKTDVLNDLDGGNYLHERKSVFETAGGGGMEGMDEDPMDIISIDDDNKVTKHKRKVIKRQKPWKDDL